MEIIPPQPPCLTFPCPFPTFVLLYHPSAPLLMVSFRFCQSDGCMLRTVGEALVPAFCLAFKTGGVRLLLSILHFQSEPLAPAKLAQSRMCHVYSWLARAFALPLLSLPGLSGKVCAESWSSEGAFPTLLALREHAPSVILIVHRVCISVFDTVTAQHYS